MFRKVISSSPFVGGVAEDIFQNIHGDKFSEDVSFLATLRALVSPRMSNDDSISLQFVSSYYTAKQIENSPIVHTVCENFSPDGEGNIYIHNLISPVQEANYACLELLKTGFCTAYSGWYRLEKVTDFFRKQFYILCFINPEIKSVAIFVDNIDLRKMHYLQCSIFAFLPWYFDPSEGVSELEMALIESLRDKTTAEKYENTINKIANQYDFKTEKTKKLLTEFEILYEKIERDNVKSEITRIINTIKLLNTQIGQELQKKNELETKLLGLDTKIANGSEESEIRDYFLCNNKLVPFYVTSAGELNFGVKSYIEYFDEDMVMSAINNSYSYIYSSSDYILGEDMVKLINAIFVDRILKIRICAAYKLNLNGSVDCLANYNFDWEFNNYLPNPHIDVYRCMGNYSIIINELLRDRNYIGAISQCIASCESLNFGDSIVMTSFMESLCTHNDRNRCIELPDGRVVAAKEAIAWLKGKECDNNE